MDIHVTLRDKETGQRGVYICPDYDLEDCVIRWLWTEGNYDSAQGMFLADGHGSDDPNLQYNNDLRPQHVELLKIVDETGRLIWQRGVLE